MKRLSTIKRKRRRRIEWRARGPKMARFAALIMAGVIKRIALDAALVEVGTGSHEEALRHIARQYGLTLGNIQVFEIDDGRGNAE